MNEEKATRYHRLKRRASIASMVWTVVLFAVLLWSGWSVGIRSALEGVLPGGLTVHAVVAAYVLLLTLLNEAGSLPIAFYSGFVLERRYGLSNEPLAGWIKDQLKSLTLSLVLAIGAATAVYALIRRFPEDWWLPAAALFALLTVGLANLAPVVILPLFYRVKPLEREGLRARLLGLADRAGARVLGAYEWGLGEKTRKANAALAGLGSTRRILVSDTMLQEYSEDEIEVVLAHELAHHVHGDIWKAILFESVMILAGFYAAALALRLVEDFFGLRGAADIAGLPVLMLAAGAVVLLARPAAFALSRAHERSADRFALAMTRNPDAFVSAMRRLGAQNLAEEPPAPIVQWLFYSHPPIAERIAAARAFKVSRVAGTMR